jgi:hypothetical protein
MQHSAEYGDLSDLLRFDQPIRRAARRADSRLLTIFRVGKLTTDRFEELCIVRTVGAGGVIAHVHSPLVPRQRVRIELGNDRTWWGNILWIKEGTAGIAFDDQVDIEEVLARRDVRSDERRSSGPRLNLDCAATLRVGGRYHDVRVHDLGQSGIGLTSDVMVEEHEDVVVTLEGFPPVEGATLWRRNGRIGIAFNKPILFDELTRWLRHMFGRSCVEIRVGAP